MTHSGHAEHHHNNDDNHNHSNHAGHDPAQFKKKFWVSLALTIPVLLFSNTIQDILGFTAPDFRGSEWVSVIFGVAIFFYGGMVFLKSAWVEITAKKPGMMTLISLAITVAFAYSLAVSFGLEGMDFWWELATLVTIMLLGHWLEMAAVQSAQGALNELAKLLPDEAELVRDGDTKTVPVAELNVGDVILVRPGAAIATDGVVKKGESSVDESMLTGESKPVRKEKGAEVIGGTINKGGSLTIKVTKVGDDTALAGTMKLVSDAQQSKSNTQVIADKAAFYLTFIALAAALLTAVGWAMFSDEPTTFILQRVVTVLIIACPHALGLAIPLVVAISSGMAAKNGIIVRDRMALETARKVDVVLFDKTGTLTKGEQSVVEVRATDDDFDTKHVLSIAASVENESEHPIAKAIIQYAKKENVSYKPAKNFTSEPGRGVTAKIAKKTVHVGGPQLLESLKIKPPQQSVADNDGRDSAAKTLVYVVQEKSVIGVVMLADAVRDESKSAVRALKEANKHVAIITGDAQEVADWVAGELGIDEVHAQVLPENKSSVVKDLQRKGKIVAMVGDGVNDAPALAQADVGIAIGAGTDVAIESAGIVLASSDPRGVAKIITLSSATYKKMLQNLAWATGYNVLALPLAAGVLAGVGFILSPAVGAVVMSVSTIVAALNAQLLRKLKL